MTLAPPPSAPAAEQSAAPTAGFAPGTAGPSALAGTVPAPADRRAVACLVDAAVVLPGVLLTLLGVLPLLASAGAPRLGVRVLLVLVGLALTGVTVAVQLRSDATRGWTVGKRAGDLRTVSARTGAPVGSVGALVRGWHDLADATLVIDVRLGRDPGAGAVDVRVAPGSADPTPAPSRSPVRAPALARPVTVDAAPVSSAPTAPPARAASTLPAAGSPELAPAPWPAPADTLTAPTVPTRVPVATLLTAPPVPVLPTPWRGGTGTVVPVAPAPGSGTGAPVPRPAAPWVELALGDGRTVTVAGSALLGRDPVARAGEVPGTLVTMDDPARSVSKTHLAVGVDASGAWVVDRRSTNGTVVTLADGQQIFCVPEERVRLREGATVGFGGQAFTVTALATTDPAPADPVADR